MKPPNRFSHIRQLLVGNRVFGLSVTLLALAALTGTVNPRFLSWHNLLDLLVLSAPVLIVACGVTLVILTAEIDISVGSMMGLLAAGMGVMISPTHWGWPLPCVILCTLGIGAAIGLVNGFLVAFARVPSIIVTLGMLTILRGWTEILMAGTWITDLPAEVRFLGTGSFLALPLSVWAALFAVISTSFLLHWTPIGRRIVAVGSHRHAAFLVGISERQIKLLVFLVTGILAALATLVSAPQLSVIDAGFGHGYALLVVTCVVVGGVSITGGTGSLAGVTVSTLLLTALSTVLIFLRLGENATYWARAIQGGLILAAVLSDRMVPGGKP